LQGLYKLTEDIARNEQWITIFIYAIVRDATIKGFVALPAKPPNDSPGKP
jgi:hypothetical protein